MSKKTVKIQKMYQETVKPKVDTGPGITEQAHKEQTDMNFILADYHRTGLIKHAVKHAGRYDDIPAVDFQTAMYKVAQATEMFEALPADIRKRFGNEPYEFLEFVQDPNNKDAMSKMGILKGNDGIDITGAASGAPVETPVKDEPAK